VKISIKNLKKSFSQGKNIINVLDDISLEINSGEIIALLGKSGSGKSTLLSLLAGLEAPDSVSVNYDQIDISTLSEEQRCEWRSKNLGIVFQQFNLIPHLTALENVFLPLEINGITSKEKARHWLSLVELNDRSEHFPSMLSGGEQQRVAIARALAFGPSLILADEPTGNLDQETGKKVTEILFKIVREQKITMIIVTHDEELAQKADRICRISGGKCHS
jgi:putative ABC transport system ATP-binding protein